MRHVRTQNQIVAIARNLQTLVRVRRQVLLGAVCLSYTPRIRDKSSAIIHLSVEF
jgi:hypothetical protein